jgi:serine/threonine protein kinase
MITPTHPRRARKEVRLGKNSDVVYCEEDRIGQGQFGTVYRGRCPATGTIVAVKLLRDLPSAGTSEVSSPRRTAEPGADPDTRAGKEERQGPPTTTTPTNAKPRPRFPSELELLWALRGDHCPNIVHVLSVWNKPRKRHAGPPPTTTATAAASASPPSRAAETRERYSNVYVLVTEYCDGGDLQHCLQTFDSHMPLHVARSFTYQLCNALYTLKRRRIVHRDIKPANLLLSSRNWESATLKVADFGMARAAPAPEATKKRALSAPGAPADDAADEASMAADENSSSGLLHDGDDDDTNALPSTLFYSEMGTPMYMSPERIAGQPYDFKADVYSAGMVLLEMMRGLCVRVTRVSQLRTAVPETTQRIRNRYVTLGETPPLWLDLVQNMTATDPALRYSVEDVLRHPWFAQGVGPELPPLTFALPLEMKKVATSDVSSTTNATSNKSGEDKETAGRDSSIDGRAGQKANTRAAEGLSVGVPPGGTPAGTAKNRAATGNDTDQLPPPTQAKDESGKGGVGDSPTAVVGGRRHQEPSSHWSLLGVCAGIEPQHNTARSVYVGPTPKSRHGGSTFTTFMTPNTAAAATASGLAFPVACGPHVITHAVRGFVDAVYLYVLQDELDPVGGLTLVSYLVELLQNGFAAYLECLECMGSVDTDVASSNPTALAVESVADVNSTSSGSDAGVCVDGHRFIVKDVGGLPEVWQQLMVRLSHAQAVFTAQLQPRMLQSAALWRRRVLQATLNAATTTTTTTTAAGEEGGVDGTSGVGDAEDCQMRETSTSSSEGEAAMPGLPNVASITNVAAAARDDSTSTAAPAGGGATTASASPPLRVYTLTTRAEQLIFAKAVDSIQSEALAILMSTPSLPPHRCGGNDDDFFYETDCLQEEEEAAAEAQLYHRGRGVSPASASPQPLSASTTTADTHAAMPPHRGIALLRVLLQRAVLSAAEVGLEPEDATVAAGRGPPPPHRSPASPAVHPTGDSVNAPSTTAAAQTSLPSTTTAAVTAATTTAEAEACEYAFVVQVPVYATLQPSDVQVVEGLLCAATRVFANSHRLAS